MSKPNRYLEKSILVIVMVWVISTLIIQNQPYIFIDNLNLLFHEAGHWIFLPFGEFMRVLGGSLTQLIIPIAIAVHFAIRKDWLGTLFGTFWLGENWINVSYYAADAEKQILPLLGNGTHDWHYLLTQVNLLNQAEAIGTAMYWLGACLMFTTLFSLLYLIIAGFRESTDQSLVDDSIERVGR